MQIDLLIQQLTDTTQSLVRRAEALKVKDLSTLTRRPGPNEWNVLECLEHLNLYGDFYLPQMASKIHQSNTPSVQDFKGGWLGSYFAQSMLPKPSLNKMKTFQDKNPLNKPLGMEVLDRYLSQQAELLDLLQLAPKVNLNKIRIPTSISPLIKLKLGDTFQFYVNHMLRHFEQIDRVLKS